MSKLPAISTSRRSLELVPRAYQPSAIPTPLTPLVGRDTALAEVLALLDDPEVRLLTLTGPGGVGKTRLATEAAIRVEHEFSEGVALAHLAMATDPSQVPAGLAEILGVRAREERFSLETLARALRDWHMLLVLDNFEHLLDVPPTWLAMLLGECPRIKVLVTSRTALDISGEHRYDLPPLAVPATNAPGDGPETGAVALFIQRAKARQPEFALNDANRESVVNICRELDGLPLAIELAAARVTVLTPEQIAARLSDRLLLLTGGKRDAPRTTAIDAKRDRLESRPARPGRPAGVQAPFRLRWRFHAPGDGRCCRLDVARPDRYRLLPGR